MAGDVFANINRKGMQTTGISISEQNKVCFSSGHTMRPETMKIVQEKGLRLIAIIKTNSISWHNLRGHVDNICSTRSLLSTDFVFPHF